MAKAEAKVEISGDSKGAQKAAADAEKSLSKLGIAAGTLGKQIDERLGSTALGSKLAKSFGSFEDAGKKAFTNVGGEASKFSGLIGPAILGGTVAAGAAIGKFALDGARKFEDLALSVGKFSDATGLSTVEASKFIEVAKDLKIDPSTFESAFVKMEKGISTNRKAFGDLVKTAKDGSVDLTGTFLNVVKHLQGIKDPFDRAQESAKLFGKGFTGISEIIGTSADELSKRLNDVGNQAGKIITPEELQKAKDYRDALDKFHDSVENLQISLGQDLIPTLTNVATTAATAVDALLKVGQFAAKAFSVQDTRAQAQEQSNLNRAFTDLKNLNIGGLIGDTLGTRKQATAATKEQTAATADQVEVEAGLTRKVDLYEASLTKANNAAITAGQFREADAAATAKSAQAAEQNAIAIDKLSAANDHDISSTQAVAAQHRAATDAINAQINAVLGLTDATHGVDSAQLAYAQAQKSANDATKEAAKRGKDQALNALEAKVAVDQQVDAAKALASANVKAAGATDGSDRANKIFIGTLKFLAAQASGPAKSALQGLVTKLEDVGKQHPTPTVSVNDQASAKAQRIRDNIRGINFLSAVATINATGNAIQKIQEAIRLGQQFAGSSYTADVNAVIGRHAAGGPMSKGEVSIVGEKGPELFVAKTAGYIVPNSQLLSGHSGGWTGGGAVVNNYITVTGAVDPVSTAKQIKAILAKGERAGVR